MNIKHVDGIQSVVLIISHLKYEPFLGLSGGDDYLKHAMVEVGVAYLRGVDVEVEGLERERQLKQFLLHDVLQYLLGGRHCADEQ